MEISSKLYPPSECERADTCISERDELRAEVERLKKIQGNQARIIEGERQQIVDYDAEVERLRAEIEMLRKVIKSSPLW